MERLCLSVKYITANGPYIECIVIINHPSQFYTSYFAIDPIDKKIEKIAILNNTFFLPLFSLHHFNKLLF